MNSESRFCPVCGNPIPRKNSKYCSNACQGIGTKGIERPIMKGRASWNKGKTADEDERIARYSAKRLKNVIDGAALKILYVDQNLTLSEIGKQYGVSKGVVSRLVEEFGFKRQSRKMDDLTTGVIREMVEAGYRFTEIAKEYECSPEWVKELAYKAGIRGHHIQNQAGVAPNKELLHQMYWGEWLSYEQIAERLQVDLTTIPYWLRKFEIPRRSVWQTRRGKDWQAPNIDLIIHLYEAEQLGMQSIGEFLGVTKSYLTKALKDAGIQLRKSGYPNVARYTAKDGHHVRSGLELQVDDWLTDHQLPHIYEPRIGNSKYRADFLIEDTYIEIWGIVGNERYEEQRKQKLQAYNTYGLKLLSIYPRDFPKLHVLNSLTENLL